MGEKGLYPLSLPIKVFITSYLVLIGAGLLLSFWIVIESPIMKGTNIEEKGTNIEEQYPPDALQEMKAAQFYDNLRKAHIHHMGHIFMVFSVVGIYAFTREKSKIKIQIIIWATIVTLTHTLAFLIYSKILLIVFGSAYAALMIYMMIIILIDCFKPFRELPNSQITK
jgi:hypothetical protein